MYKNEKLRLRDMYYIRAHYHSGKPIEPTVEGDPQGLMQGYIFLSRKVWRSSFEIPALLWESQSMMMPWMRNPYHRFRHPHKNCEAWGLQLEKNGLEATPLGKVYGPHWLSLGRGNHPHVFFGLNFCDVLR